MPIKEIIQMAMESMRSAFRFAGITLAIIMLIPRAMSVLVAAVHRFTEVSVGIAVGLALTALWPEPDR